MMRMLGGVRAELDDDVEMVPEVVGGKAALIARVLAVQSALLRLSSRRFLAVLAGGKTWCLSEVGGCNDNGCDGTDAVRGSGVVGSGGADGDVGRLGVGCTCGLPAASAAISRDVAGAVGTIPRRWEFR